MKLIPDSELMQIPIEDNGEELVDLRNLCSNIELAITDPELDERFFLTRKSLADKINTIQSKLRNSDKLVIFSAYRPIEIQKAHYKAMLEKVSAEHDQWTKEKVEEETAKRIAPPEIIPPHTAGAAVDLTISRNGKLLDMGTGYKEFNSKTPTDSSEVTDEQKENRKYLHKLMTSEGFVNYPTEWWHFSYGDRYWAAFLNTKKSFYDSVE